jgi:hypothetical protein
MANKDPLSLDVGAAEDVARVLREAAEVYYVSAEELEADWQDPQAGRPWKDTAKILERTAKYIDQKAKSWY